MVLTVSFVLSPATGLSCHRRLRNPFRKLDASVGASGPHDFAVRQNAARLASPKRPPHPALYVRDDRETPLERRRDRIAIGLILPGRQAKFGKSEIGDLQCCPQFGRYQGKADVTRTAQFGRE